MRPLIGIPPCLDDRGRWRSGRDYHYLDAAYSAALAAVDAVAVVVPPQPDPRSIAARLDGLLLPGGDDFAPERPYPAGVSFEVVPARQLAFDRGLLEAALELGLPVLGICYGMQLLALQGGGSLHHHLPTDLPDAAPHRLSEPDGRHRLTLEPSTRLTSIFGASAIDVNSLHHQAVASPGRSARIAARAPDAVIEAIELEGPSFAIGVQWHPEKLDSAHRDALFGAFAAACLQRIGS
jgi:putative glutamine amidotransferase